MNAALLMMTSTILAGADAAPGGPVAPPATVVSAGPGCGSGGCGPVASGGCCDPCAGGKAGLFDRLKSRMGGGLCGKHKSADCGCAPAPCNDCESARPNLFDRLKGKFGKHHKADCGGCDGCAAGPAGCAAGSAGCAAPLPPGAAPAVPPSADPPKEMPKPKDIPKVAPPKVSGNGADAGAVPSISIPTPGAVVVPALPVTPVSGPKLNGTTSPY